MLSKRILLAGAAASAALAIAIPAAYADPPAAPKTDDQKVWQEAPADKAPAAASDSGKEAAKPAEKPAAEKPAAEENKSDGESSAWAEKAPHGGVHTGGGALAVSGGGLATGAALLAGGIGVGAVALRRRRPTGAAV